MSKRIIFLVSFLFVLMSISGAFAQSSIGWGNLQWPLATQTMVGQPTENIYGQVWMDGVTNSPGQGAGITAEVGYGAVGTDPVTWTDWVQAAYNTDVGNNDEYKFYLKYSRRKSGFKCI